MSQSQLSMFDRQTAAEMPIEAAYRVMGVNRLTLRNFKKFAHFEITPDGRNLIIYGDNEAGKTTLMDAFMWLFFDK
ncbi:MAG TPA: AAA family ATPase, partial [Firmicutes bacterium]|nr:AAA family ATPase [Candidatus Fermentithermobacillaceae bacterium]